VRKNLLIVGAGGVAQVVAHKAATVNDVIGDIHIASRTLAKCHAIVQSVRDRNALKVPGALEAHQLDAMDVEATQALIARTQAGIVINVGSPFLNMSVLRACIETGAAYLDTAIHEDASRVCEAPPWYENYEWTLRSECARKGITAILGAGFDPGVVNAYAALAADEFFDTIESLDIIDVNAGSHGKYFATNFDPEINLREFTGAVWSWQDSRWTSNRMFEVHRTDELPIIGTQKTYLTGHDEVHSLSVNLKIPNVRFWMSFSEQYIEVFTVLKRLGLLSHTPVTTAEGVEVVPLKLVKAVLPDPASLAPHYTGKTCIGTLVRGAKSGKPREVFLYNVSDHAETFRETGSQAISYTAGVPPVAAAVLIAQGEWDVRKMVNVEELPARPFLQRLARMGLPTHLRDAEGNRPLY